MEKGKVVEFSRIKNQKVNKPKKRLKKKIKGFFFSLFIMMVIGGMFYFASPVSRLSVIYFNGLNYVKRSELLEMTQLNYEELFLSLDLKDIQNTIQSHPLVKEVNVTRDGLNRLKIDVTEKDIVGCAQINNQFEFVLSDGQTIQNQYNLKAQCEGLMIYGLPDYEENQSVLKLFVKSLMKVDLVFRNIIKEIHYSPLYGDNNRFSLFLMDGNTIIVNSYTMVNKLKYYQTMADKVQSLNGEVKGIYHLDVGDHFEPYEKMSIDAKNEGEMS
ncbi:MAG: cell division protein FtsQ/DivIB [Turicibacter sanguinis]